MYLSNNQRKRHHHVKLTRHWKVTFKQTVPVHDLSQAFMDVESFEDFLFCLEHRIIEYFHNAYFEAWVKGV